MRSKEVNFRARVKKNTAVHKPVPPMAWIPFAGLNEVFKTKGSWDFAQHVVAYTH